MVGNNELAKFVVESLKTSPVDQPPPYAKMRNIWNRKTRADRGNEPTVTISTMRRAVQASREGRAVGVQGVPTRKDDTLLRTFILEKVDEGVRLRAPIQPEDLLDAVNQYIKDQPAEDARSRRPLTAKQLDNLVIEIGVKRVTLLPVENARITKSNMSEVVRFAEQYVYALSEAEALQGGPVQPYQCVNCDEVGCGGHYVRDTAQYGYVSLDAQGKFYRPSTHQSNHITVVVASSPCPLVKPGGLIISRQEIDGHPRLPDPLERHIGTLKEFGWTFHVDKKTSSMTKTTLMDWMPSWLKDYRARNGIDATTPLIVFADGHASRYNPKLWDALREDRVFLILLPAHLTHVFQVVDTHLARMMKKRRDLWGMKFEGVSLLHPMRTLGGVLRHLLAVAVGGAEHKEGWLSDGLYPLNLTCFDGRGFLDQQDPELKAMFLNAPLDFQKLCKYIKKLARKYPYPVTSEQVKRRQLGGVCVTHNEVLRELRTSIAEEFKAGNTFVAGRWVIGGPEDAEDAAAEGDEFPDPIDTVVGMPILEEEIQVKSAPEHDDWPSSDDEEYRRPRAAPPPPRKRRKGG